MRVDRRWVTLLALVILGATLGLSPAHAADADRCLSVYKPALQIALAADDFAGLSVLLADNEAPAACAPAWVDAYRVNATRRVVARADRLVGSGDVEAADALLRGRAEARFRFATLWSVNAILGDIAAARKDWGEAALQYGTAYELAVEPGAMPGRDRQQAEAVQVELFRLANEALQLTGDLGLSVSRSGQGRWSLGSRGPKPQMVPVPVRFAFNSAELDDAARRDAERIAALLRSRQLSRLRLVGHTDWKGCRAYNQTLSEQRAANLGRAIAQAYRRLGDGELTVDSTGAGESCPPVLSDPGRYDDEQLRSLYRRVEIELGPGVGEAACDQTVLREDPSSCG